MAMVIPSLPPALPPRNGALKRGRIVLPNVCFEGWSEWERLAQRPLFVDGQQVGALYVQIPFDLFAMDQQLDMFDGRGGTFCCFKGRPERY